MSALKIFFGALRLDQIMPGHLRLYQEHRLANIGGRWKSRAGASYINHELNTLKQMMDVAGEWKRVQLHYQPLPLPTKQPQRVMTEEEEQQFFNAAKSDPDCFLAYIVAVISNNTTASGAELRSIQLRHVFLDGPEPEIEIPHEMVKNSYRARRIPLTDQARHAVEQAVIRALHLGCTEPTDYLFPMRVKTGTYDPSLPASPSWIRKQWEKLRAISGIPWVRPHDMRHQAITRMLEGGANEDAVRSVAGHVSQDILRRYSHQRHAAKKAALSVLDRSARPLVSVACGAGVPRPTTKRNIVRRTV